MSGLPAHREVFARTMLALRPYAADVVLIGGWVHALYLAEAAAHARPVHTTDIDLSLPPALPANDRPPLLDLTSEAGFQVDTLDPGRGDVALWQRLPDGGIVDLDLLTDAPDPRVPVPIAGQPHLVVPGYPDQHILRENARWMHLGADFHPLLDPPVSVRVPEVGAYALVKALSSARRPGRSKRAKDVVYLYEILRRTPLRERVVVEMPRLAARYPAEYAAWRSIVAATASERPLLDDVTEQLLAGYHVIGEPEAIAASVATHLRRILAETPG